MPDGKLWTQRDRYDNEIYLTHERWSHITEASNHPELAMNKTNYHYDREADVLYISFGASEHTVTVELSVNLIFRLDLGKENGGHHPTAIGMTVLFPAQLLRLGHSPLRLELDRLRRQSPEIQSAVLQTLSQPPVSEVLLAELAFAAPAPPLPELLAAA